MLTLTHEQQLAKAAADMRWQNISRRNGRGPRSRVAGIADMLRSPPRPRRTPEQRRAAQKKFKDSIRAPQPETVPFRAKLTAYFPHQSDRERARRMRQNERAQLSVARLLMVRDHSILEALAQC